MKLNNLFNPEYLRSNVQSSKKMIGYIAITIILITSVVWAGGKLIMVYAQAEDVKEQMVVMEDELATWQSEADYVNGQRFRPVITEQVEAVQTDVLRSLHNHKLELSSFKAIPNNSQTQKAFEISFKGSYENTLNYLNNFHSRDALINIVNLKMSADNSDIMTVIRYIVYVK